MIFINTIGQIVASWNETNLPMTNEIRIAVDDLSRGAYIL